MMNFFEGYEKFIAEHETKTTDGLHDEKLFECEDDTEQLNIENVNESLLTKIALLEKEITELKKEKTTNDSQTTTGNLSNSEEDERVTGEEK